MKVLVVDVNYNGGNDYITTMSVTFRGNKKIISDFKTIACRVFYASDLAKYIECLFDDDSYDYIFADKSGCCCSIYEYLRPELKRRVIDCRYDIYNISNSLQNLCVDIDKSLFFIEENSTELYKALVNLNSSLDVNDRGCLILNKAISNDIRDMLLVISLIYRGHSVMNK